MCRIRSPAAALSSWGLVRAHRAGYLPHSKDPTGFLSLAANAATVPSLCSYDLVPFTGKEGTSEIFRALWEADRVPVNGADRLTGRSTQDPACGQWPRQLQGQSLNIHPRASGPVAELAARSTEDKQILLATRLSWHWAASSESSSSRELLLKGKRPQLPQAYNSSFGKIHALTFKGCQWLAQHTLVLPDPYFQPYSLITINPPTPAPHTSPSGLWSGHMSLANLEFIFLAKN